MCMKWDCSSIWLSIICCDWQHSRVSGKIFPSTFGLRPFTWRCQHVPSTIKASALAITASPKLWFLPRACYKDFLCSGCIFPFGWSYTWMHEAALYLLSETIGLSSVFCDWQHLSRGPLYIAYNLIPFFKNGMDWTPASKADAMPLCHSPLPWPLQPLQPTYSLGLLFLQSFCVQTWQHLFATGISSLHCILENIPGALPYGRCFCLFSCSLLPKAKKVSWEAEIFPGIPLKCAACRTELNVMPIC